MPTYGSMKNQVQWLGKTGNIESFDESEIYAGQLGQKVELTASGKRKVYQQVLIDSNAVAAADVAPADALAAYWKDKANFLVTTDRRFTEGIANDPNKIAGVFRCSATPGQYTWIQKEGIGDCNFNSGTTPAQGAKVVAGAATAAGAEFVGVNAATAPAYTEVGDIVENGAAGATVEVDLSILD